MAKKNLKLDFLDIVMGADADVIKKAYEAKIQIDELLKEREEAYRKIAELEEQIDGVAGIAGEFIFPQQPLKVAGISKPIPAARTFAKGKKIVQKEEPETDENDLFDDSFNSQEHNEEEVIETVNETDENVVKMESPTLSSISNNSFDL